MFTKNAQIPVNETFFVTLHAWMFFKISDRITYVAPPIVMDRVSFPPGTTGEIFGVKDEELYLSDHDIAAGISPKRTRTAYEPRT